MFGAFLLSRPAVIGTRPLSLSADVLYSWRNPYLLFGCRPKREPLILLGETQLLFSVIRFGMSSMIEIEQASAHSEKVTIPAGYITEYTPVYAVVNFVGGISLPSTGRR